MRTNIFCFLVLMFIVFCYAFGIITSKYAQCNPTPEQCLSVCVEEFEKMAA
jgi:hypothetical protein